MLYLRVELDEKKCVDGERSQLKCLESSPHCNHARRGQFRLDGISSLTEKNSAEKKGIGSKESWKETKKSS